MTPTNEQELKELAELREYVKELEDAVLFCCLSMDRYDTYYCQMCDCIEPCSDADHKPDCIVTKIRNRRESK